MGASLSANFETVGDPLVTGCWRVWSATHIESGAPVSLWVLDYQILKARFPSAEQRLPYVNGFLKALQAAKKMVHPHILKIIEVQEDPQHLEFVSEPINCPLRTLIGSLDSNESCYIAFQILDALRFVHDHAKMVHLGVSPTSVLVTKDLCVKLFNFNWMSPLGESGTVETIKNYGCNSAYPNIHYSAPEVIAGENYDPMSADIWSLGVMLYALIQGTMPWHNQDLHALEEEIMKADIEIPPHMPIAIAEIISACLVKEPEKRATAKELLEMQWMQMEKPEYERMFGQGRQSKSLPPIRDGHTGAASLTTGRKLIMKIGSVKQVMHQPIRAVRSERLAKGMAMSQSRFVFKTLAAESVRG